MGILKEDEEIHESRLVKLFVAEGFLKPNKLHTLEEIAQDYLKELVDRNLILVSKWRWNGTAKFYYVHDLLREVCLREAEKEKFLHVMNVLDVSQGIDLEERLIVIHDYTSKHTRELDALLSAPLVRSLILKGGPLSFRFRLLKVLGVEGDDPLEVFQLVNLRYLCYEPREFSNDPLPSSASLLWDVQTLIIQGKTDEIVAPPEVWKMRQLRHLEFNLIYLPDPPTSVTTDQQEDCVMQNLQTLTNVANLSFSEEVCRRIPNIETLHIGYDDIPDNFLKIDLGSLRRLKSLKCLVIEEVGDFVMELVLPSSLEKLSLISCRFHWDKVTRIGMTLPHKF